MKYLLLILALIPNCYGIGFFDHIAALIDKYLHDVVHSGVLENAECVSQIGEFLQNLAAPHGDPWALTMIDASAKVPSGILEMNLVDLGRFGECIDVKTNQTDVVGKYCLTAISLGGIFDWIHMLENDLNITLIDELPKKMFQLAFLPSFGVCIPNKCTEADMETVMSTLVAIMPWLVTCQTKEDTEKPLDIGAIVTLSFFGVVLSIMIISTIYDYIRDKSTKPKPASVAFSIYTNGEKLLKMSDQRGDLDCLNGIRFMSMIYVIYGHVYASGILGLYSNIDDMVQFFHDTKSMIVSNAVNSVDSFLVVSGLLVVYGFMNKAYKGESFNIVKHVVHRYLRLTPPLIPVILFSIYLAKYVGSGPIFPTMTDGLVTQPCKANWWATLLHSQNLFNAEKDLMCISQSWYLNVDFHMYLLAPAYLLLLPKYPKLGLSIMASLVAGSMMCGYFFTRHYNLTAIQTNLSGILKYNRHYYFSTPTRCASWVIGGMLGYLLSRIKHKRGSFYLGIPKWFSIPIWLIALALLPTCIFFGHNQLSDSVYHADFDAYYNTFIQPVWALSICWIIFACACGQGGIINKLLSWRFYQVLNRFTYSVYLTHLTMLYLISFANKEPAFFSMFNAAYSFWGILAMSSAVSVIWVLAFESPITVLEDNYLWKSNGKRKKTDKITVQSVDIAAEP